MASGADIFYVVGARKRAALLKDLYENYKTQTMKAFFGILD